MISRRGARVQAELDRLNADLPRYCSADIDSRGNVRVYFRREIGSPKLRLREKPFTPDFHHEYADAMKWPHDSTSWRRRKDGCALPPAKRSPPETTYTLGWLVASYFKSSEFRSLKKQRVRRLVLDGMMDEAVTPDDPNSPLVGDRPLEGFDDRDVRALMERKVRWVMEANPEDPDGPDRIAIRRGTEAANSRVKALRSVLNYGFTTHREHVTDLWAHKVKLYPPSAEGFHCWTLTEIDQFRSFYIIGTKERLAFELLYWTGQRRGDIVRLSRFLVQGNVWQVRQEKNQGTDRATTAYVPILPELRDIIRESQGTGVLGDTVYLVSERSGAFTKESFGNWFRDVCDRAGLPQCSAHGLRKAFVVQMIFRRINPHEIMAITGHRTQKEFDRYAREYLRREAALRVYEELCRQYHFGKDDPVAKVG